MGEPQLITLPRGSLEIRPVEVDFLERCPLPNDTIGNYKRENVFADT